MRSSLLLGGALAVPALFVACVSNDPVTNTPATNDGGTNDASSPQPSSDAAENGETSTTTNGLDPTFGTNGSLSLSGNAVGLTALPGNAGDIVWAENTGDHGVLHRLGQSGQPDETAPGFNFEVTPDPANASEAITALAVGTSGGGTPIVLVGGSGVSSDDAKDWWARGFDPTGAYAVIASNQPASASGVAESLNALTFDPATGTIIGVRTGQQDSAPPYVVLQSQQAGNEHLTDNGAGAAIVADPSGGFVGAAIALPDGSVSLMRTTTPSVPSIDPAWNDGQPLSFPVTNGATGVGLMATSDGVLAAGLSRASEAFFQAVDETGKASGALTTLPISGVATGFAGTVLQPSGSGNRLVLAGCVGGQPWVGAFTTTGTPAYDGTFGNGGQLTIAGTAGECPKAVAVDGKGRVLVLIGTTGGASNRIVRLAL